MGKAGRKISIRADAASDRHHPAEPRCVPPYGLTDLNIQTDVGYRYCQFGNTI
jgi:hypothetical protein